jgi:hypothetical protein
MSWVNTARIVSDIGKEVGDTTISNGPGIIFRDGSFIEIANQIEENAGRIGLKWIFKCTAGREEIESDIFFEIVDFLWRNHSIYEWSHV